MPAMLPPGPPETRYVECGGVNLAYQVIGDGPLDLLFIPGWISNIDLFWESRRPAEFFGRLAAFARLIVYDKPGTGLSDPVEQVPTLEERVEQVMAILDVAGSERATVVGLSEGGATAALTAAMRPDRVASLVMLNAFPGLDRRALSSAKYRAFTDWADEAVRQWGSGRDAERWMPSLAGRPDLHLVWGRVQRACASPATARRYREQGDDYSSWDVLPIIRQPTLVLHRRGDRIVPAEFGRATASRIPGAQLSVLDGDDHLPWLGDADAVVDAIRAFVGAGAAETTGERVLATVLFTDLVGSTDRLAAVGDARWRRLLEEHNRVADEVVARHRGRIVADTGDGILATFDGPARAVRAAGVLLDELASMGLEARAGVHTGEIEVRGDGNVAGLAVHIGARVMGVAAAGEIVVSRTVRDLVAGSGLAFAPRGSHALKGVPDEWELYGVERAGSAAPVP